MTSAAILGSSRPKLRDKIYVLKPFSREEALSLDDAAEMAGVSPLTIKNWCAKKGLGRCVSGRVWVSRVALAAYLDGDEVTLAAYLRGSRTAPRVVAYFQRLGIPIIPQIIEG